jgi:hypothetical protein
LLQHKHRHNQESQGLSLANLGESNVRQVHGLLQLEYQLQLLELEQVAQLLQVLRLLLLRYRLMEQLLLLPLLDLLELPQVYLQLPNHLPMHFV